MKFLRIVFALIVVYPSAVFGHEAEVQSSSCAALTAPYHTDFEGIPLGPGNINLAGGWNNCWTFRSNSANPPRWESENSTGANENSLNTGPFFDGTYPTTAGGTYMFLESGYGDANTSAELVSPAIDISPLATAELRFKYHMYGSNINKLVVIAEETSSGLQTRLDSLMGQQQTAGSDSFLLRTTSLQSLSGNTYRFIFQAFKGSSFRGDISIDEVRVDDCPAPFNIFAYAGSNFLSFRWTGQGATYQNYVIGPAGTTPANGTVQTTQNDTVSIYGINYNTVYSFWVRDSCGPSSKSAWTGPFYIRSASCAALTAPYHTDFEGIPLGPGNLNLAGGWNNCWTFRSNSFNPPRWESENSTGANENSLNTGPFFDGTYPTTAGGTYMFLESGYGDANTSAELVSPAIDISPLATAELRFKYHMYGSNINKLVVIAEETSSGLQTRLDSLMGQQQTAGSDSFLLRTTSLQSLSGNTYRFIFQAFKGSSFRGDISIDEVRVDDCPAPFNIFAYAGSNFLSFRWTGQGAAYQNYVIGPAGTTPANGTVQTTQNDTVSIYGINYNTVYSFWVRDSCGPSSKSAWTGPFNIRSASCAALTAPYHTNFEGIPLGPGNLNLAGGWNNCWTFRSNSFNPPRWESENSTGANENSLNTGPFFDGTYPTTAGGTYMFLESGYGDANTSAELVSPAIDISPLATAELRFKYHMYGSNINKLVVIAEETSSGLQTRLDSLMGQQQTAGSDSFLLRTTSLQSLSGNTYRFIFQAFKGSSFRGDISIDEVRVDDCPAPFNIFAYAGSNFLSFRWTGQGAAYQNYVIGPAGTTPANGTVQTTQNDTVSIYGINYNTVYSFWVRDSCGPSSKSAWTGPFNIRSASCAALTAPYHTNFEGIPLGPGNLNLAGGWNNCWTFRSNSFNPPRWESENSTGANENSLNTGPFFDGTYPTTAGGTYMFLESGYGDANTSAELVSPAIDISPLATAELRFKYHMYGSNINKLVVIAEETSSGLQTRLDSLMGQQQTAGSDSFLLRTTSLQSLSGNAYRFIFQAFKGSSSRGDISIDEVRVEASCLGISADTSIVCIGDSIQLRAHVGSASGSLLWSTGDTARTIWVSPQQATTFYCTLTSGSTQCSDSLRLEVLRGTGIDSVGAHDANKGLLIAYFDASDQFAHKLEYKLEGSNTWRTKNLSQGAIRSGSQRFNITPWFNSLLEVRMSSLINGAWEEGCSQSIQSPCKGMTVAIVQQKAPFCPEDSALLRAGISGGLGNKSYLWSNGATTKRTYAQQTQSLWVTVTDAAGCAVTDTFTVPSLGSGVAPSNLQVNTAAGVIQAQWTPSVFSSGQSLIGYRLAYRLRNTQLWSKTPLISDTTYAANWSGSGNPSGNYEFAVFARFLSNGTPQNSGYSCKVVKGYTASTSKSSTGNGTSSDAADGHSGIGIYPNPTNDLVHLHFPAASEWILCDLQGNVLWQDSSLKNEALIDLSVYAAGVYILHVKNSNGTHSARVIKN